MHPKSIVHWWSQERPDRDLAVGALRRRTHKYWRQRGTMEQRLAQYVEDLLPDELEYAEKRGTLRFRPCHTLALLVGYSLEPLLQTISVFQPERRLVLLLNRWYGSPNHPDRQRGQDRGEDVQELLEDILFPLLRCQPEVALCEVDDQPDAVFHALCEQLLPDQRARRDIVVDITGAKKSMDAGAFLFAAYADIPISYVDFDDYDEDKRRPFGFTCRIGTIANPYEEFRLREWERVRRLYSRYHFRAAAETLIGILGIMREPLFERAHIRAVENLQRILQIYKAWDDGDYWHAKELASRTLNHLTDFSPPVAVTLLGDVWPHAERELTTEEAAERLQTLHDELRHYPHYIFTSNELLITYARDELAKIKRLVEANEDNRSALLRSAGLDELLLKARLVRLWHAGGNGRIGLWDSREKCLGRGRTFPNPDLGKRLYWRLLNHDNADYMRAALQKRRTYDYYLSEEIDAYVRLDVRGVSYRARPIPDKTPTLEHYEEGIELSGETLTQLRNRAIHTYLYVTQPIAQAAVELAEANLEDLEQNWTKLSTRDSVPRIAEEHVKQLTWDQLCHLCGLDFLPLIPPVEKPSREKKEENA